MAKVFTRRIIIPGEKIGEYLKAMEEAEKAREPFRRYAEDLRGEFEDFLSERFSPRTASRHNQIVHMFIEFLCGYTDVEGFEGVTRGMANTHFRNWYRRKVWDSATPNDLKVALRRFFQFLASEKGIVNEKVLKGLR